MSPIYLRKGSFTKDLVAFVLAYDVLWYVLACTNGITDNDGLTIGFIGGVRKTHLKNRAPGSCGLPILILMPFHISVILCIWRPSTWIHM